MDFKQSLFGGYRKDSVDAVMRQMKENEEQYQGRIALLDNEFRLSKETTQKNIESIQTELVIRQKSVSDLSRTLDERNVRIAELEERQQSIASEFEKQYGAILSEMKVRHDAALADMEEKYSAKIAGLQERSRQETMLARQTDDQVRKIGQLYVDAQEYTEKMKAEAKNKMMDSIDSVFAQLDKMQERYEESFAQISEKKLNLSRLVTEMQENLISLQDKMSSMDSEKTDFSASFENINVAKEQIRQKIQNDDGKGRETEEKAPEPEKSTVASFQAQPAQTAAPAVPAAPAAPSVDFSAQIEELKQKIERQERLLFLRSAETKPVQEPAPPLPAQTPLEESVFPGEEIQSEPESEPEEARVFVPSLEEQAVRRNDGETVRRDDEEIVHRDDKESLERENYNRYFEEIRKKYSKEPNPATSNQTPPSSLEAAPAGSLSDAPHEPQSNDNGIDITDNEETPVTKKPSIKDILNKYANMK